MGYWFETTYIYSDQLDKIEEGFNSILENESFSRLYNSFPNKLIYNNLLYGEPEANDLLYVRLSAGVPGWTLVRRTAPRWLLNYYAPGFSHPRLADLTVKIGCDAFLINVYDGDSFILLEANAQGEFAFSGGGFTAREVMKDIESLIPDEYYCKEDFRLIQVPEDLRKIVANEELDVMDKVIAINETLMDQTETEELDSYSCPDRELYYWRKDVPFPTEVGSSSLVS